MFRGDVFVTIAEIHTLILEVCVCLHITVFRSFFYYYLDFIEKAKMVCSIMTVLLKSIR